MKRLLISLVAVVLVLINLGTIGAEAQPLISAPSFYLAQTPEPVQILITKLETEVLPQIEAILTPEQQEALQIDISEGGTSFRKALKSLSVTPEQKTQLKALIKSLPKDDAFATLTPEERKQFFMKKKEYFMPSAEEISEKISNKMKMIKAKVETQLESIAAE
ncbi:MAG: hypothetical protein HC827_22655 [Cyanobacteria bacterium RM1_2_2]|nr:hypothetical protein [Cyanobacteria bacterium RM1_2_2]